MASPVEWWCDKRYADGVDVISHTPRKPSPTKQPSQPAVWFGPGGAFLPKEDYELVGGRPKGNPVPSASDLPAGSSTAWNNQETVAFGGECDKMKRIGSAPRHRAPSEPIAQFAGASTDRANRFNRYFDPAPDGANEQGRKLKKAGACSPAVGWEAPHTPSRRRHMGPHVVNPSPIG